MAEICILWLHPEGPVAEDPGVDTAGDKCRWLVLDAQGNRVGHPQRGNLSDAAPICAGRKTILLLAGERIHDLHASIPGKNPQKLLQAAPYALEDRFAEDIEDLHFALLERLGQNRQRFLVVDRTWLRDTLDVLAEHDIRPVSALPDYLGVEVEADTEHWFLLGSRLLARTADGLGFAADIRYVDGLWPVGEDEATPRISLQEDESLPESIRARSPEHETLAADALFTRMARTVNAVTGPGLLQGEFRPRRQGNEKFRRWRPVAALATALLTVLVLDWGIDVWRLNKQLAILEEQTEQQFHRILPDASMGKDPRGQVDSAIKGSSQARNLALDMIAALGLSLAETGDARLQAFSYRGNRLEFSVIVKDAERLEALRQSLEGGKNTLQVKIASANAQGEMLEGRLTMEAVER